MDTQGHISSEFNEALDELRNNTIEIASLTKKNVEKAFAGLTLRDKSLCSQVVGDDEEIDQLEMTIDNNSLLVMSKFRPFASDLRLVIASMKITHNLERISDHAVSIAKRSQKILKDIELDEISYIEPIYHHAIKMLDKAIVSYIDTSSSKAQQVIELSKDLHPLHKKANKLFTTLLEQPSDYHKAYLNLIFIIRWFERIGDLSTNIAEDVIFLKSAQDIRHSS